jgi:hypothetical protein
VTRGRLAAATVAVAAAVAVVLMVVFARGWWHDKGGSYAPRAGIVASTRIVPGASLFGTVLTARATVLVDPGQIDPQSIRLESNFSPYVVLSASKRNTPDLGRAVAVTFSYRIQCVIAACLPLMEARKGQQLIPQLVRLRPARITARGRTGVPLARRLLWPEVVVQPRVTPQEIAAADPRIESGFPRSPIGWAISPDLLGALLVSAAAILVLGAGALVASAVGADPRRLRVRRIPAHLTPIDRALALAEHAAAHGEYDEGRKALERLAMELGRHGDRRLAVQAGRLAWSEEDPSADAVDELAAAVKGNSDG